MPLPFPLTRTLLSTALILAVAGCGAPALAPAVAPGVAARALAASEIDWKALFRVLDGDRDGALVQAELGLEPKQLAAFDLNGDGRVVPAEWLAEAGPEAQSRQAAFAGLEAAADAMGAPSIQKADGGRAPGPGGVARWFLNRYLNFASGIVLKRAITPNRAKLKRTPAELGLAYENVAFTTEDDVAIKGWYMPAGRETDKAVIMLHGHESNRGEMIRDGQPSWLQPEYNLLAIDMRNNGESDGSVTTFGYHEGKDVLAAVRFLKARGIRHVALYGVSMGGATAIRAAALGADVEAVVNDCAYATMLNAFKGYVAATSAPFSTLVAATALVRANKLLGLDLSDTEPVSQVAGVAPRPFFVIHGEADPLVTWDNSRINYFAAGAGLVKDLWIVPGAGHGQSMVHARAEYRSRVLDFLGRNF